MPSRTGVEPYSSQTTVWYVAPPRNGSLEMFS